MYTMTWHVHMDWQTCVSNQYINDMHMRHTLRIHAIIYRCKIIKTIDQGLFGTTKHGSSYLIYIIGMGVGDTVSLTTIYGMGAINQTSSQILTSTSDKCPAMILRGCILSIDQILAVRSCEALAK